MNKPLLWIFGDSYGHNHKTSNMGDPEWKNLWMWPSELARIFDIENFAISGSGPHTQIRYFLDAVHDRELEYCSDINVIFFISDPARINFNFYQTPFHQTYPKTLVSYNATKAELEWKKYYKDKNKFITNYFKYVDIDKKYETEKYVSMLKMYSKFFKKVLVFNCFTHTNDTITTIINDEKFHLVNEPMINISRFNGSHDLPNHLSTRNHKIMYSQLVGHFLNNQNVMYRKFLKN